MEKGASAMKGRKYLQVLEGARTIFMRDGFEGASVDDIAHEAGVSKATLYSYFPDKRIMFTEVFRAELARDTADAGALLEVDLPVRQILPFIVQMIAAHVVSDFGKAMYRVSVAEAERFPTLAREYYEAGPVQLRKQMVRYLRHRAATGELEIPDFELAADQLIKLSGASLRDRALFMGSDAIDAELMRKVADGAVRMFLACYGTGAQGLRAVGE